MQWHSVVIEISGRRAPESSSGVILSCGLGLKNCLQRFTWHIHGEFCCGWGEVLGVGGAMQQG